jgi:ATP-dependent helicase/nuclease subunit A
VLRLACIPVSCEATTGYFETTEISDCLCLLKVLDNPQRDIELAAVLRSPFFKISDTELAKIKLHSMADEQYKNFYNCVQECSVCGPDVKLAGRLEEILALIEQWRTLARRGNLADLIWQIYRQSGFLSYICALPNGQARRANLLKLHDRAIQFEGFASSGGLPSLMRFVEFIEKLQEAGRGWAAEPEASMGNAVRVISVHKSKGLEFPVVFLAELDSQFSKKDSQEDCLANADGTLGLRIIDSESNTKLDSIAYQVIERQKKEMSLAEEMRILYVATTRARERLILSACEKKSHCQDIISNGFFFGDEPVADWQLRGCGSALEWVLYGLSDQKNLHEAFETGLAKRCSDDDLFSIKLYGQTELERLCGFIQKLKDKKSYRCRVGTRSSQRRRTETKLLSEVKKSLSWCYRFGEAPVLPAKLSVTQLTHRNDEYVKIDYCETLERKPKAVLSVDSAELVDGRLIGAATHLVISQLDLAGSVTKDAIEKTKEKLLVDNAVSEAVAEHINTKSIIGFFENELGGAVLNVDNVVWCEWPFTLALPASELSNSGDERQATSDEVVIVQGIIDMVVRTPEGLLIIDFKTDNISAGEVSERAELYRKQLELYGRAAGAILKTKVLSKWLYFLTPNCAIEVK